ncbi:hypothetical protein WR25_02730 [Diploscapter pachys]|uniref:Maelstrom domain-containing protein n=1 Tax=Diploscapter pachys TaxID=2018661 RepID=A0A2A2JQP1_9BILA|nr:hypothetical protein WR25_02730 [Diploscapter pachys]
MVKVSGYFLWEMLEGRELFRNRTRGEFNRNSQEHKGIMTEIYSNASPRLKELCQEEAERMNKDKKEEKNYAKALGNLRAQLTRLTAGGSRARLTTPKKAATPKEPPANLSLAEFLASLEEHEELKVEKTSSQLEMSNVYKVPSCTYTVETAPECLTYMSREGVNWRRVSNSTQFTCDLRSRTRELKSPENPFNTRFFFLSLFPHTIAFYKDHLLVSPFEISLTEFSFSQGITDQKIWFCRFDLHKVYGEEGEKGIPEWNKVEIAHMERCIGRPVFPNERSWSIKDPDVVWKEMLEFLGKRKQENSKIIYDVEQHNYIMPAVHYLAHYKDDLETPDQLNTFMHLLLCVQDLALSFNRLFGTCKDLHPFAVDRFFVRPLKPLDNRFYCSKHDIFKGHNNENGRLHCPLAHAARMVHSLYHFAMICRFDQFSFHPTKHTYCRSLDLNELYSMGSTFSLPTQAELTLPVAAPETTAPCGRVWSVEDYMMKSLQEMKTMEMQTRNGQEALQNDGPNGQMEQRNGNRFNPRFVPQNLHAALRAEGFTANQHPQRPVTYRDEQPSYLSKTGNRRMEM